MRLMLVYRQTVVGDAARRPWSAAGAACLVAWSCVDETRGHRACRDADRGTIGRAALGDAHFRPPVRRRCRWWTGQCQSAVRSRQQVLHAMRVHRTQAAASSSVGMCSVHSEHGPDRTGALPEEADVVDSSPAARRARLARTSARRARPTPTDGAEHASASRMVWMGGGGGSSVPTPTVDQSRSAADGILASAVPGRKWWNCSALRRSEKVNDSHITCEV